MLVLNLISSSRFSLVVQDGTFPKIVCHERTRGSNCDLALIFLCQDRTKLIIWCGQLSIDDKGAVLARTLESIILMCDWVDFILRNYYALYPLGNSRTRNTSNKKIRCMISEIFSPGKYSCNIQYTTNTLTLLGVIILIKNFRDKMRVCKLISS